MEQVLAKFPLSRALLQILMRGRDDAHVHPDRLLAADAIELTLGQHAQQPCLQRGRHVADLIEEQRAAVRLLEAAAPQAVGARERTFLVTEQFGLEQLGGDRRGVERDERLGGARTVFVQRPRHQLLAGARLAGDQHVDARSGQPPDGAKHLLHGRRAPKEWRPRRGSAGDGAGWPRTGLRGTPHQLNRVVDVERLGQVFECAALVGRHGGPQIRVRRHHDHRQVRVGGVHAPQQIDA